MHLNTLSDVNRRGTKALDYWPIAVATAMPIGVLFGFVLAPSWRLRWAPWVPFFSTWALGALVFLAAVHVTLRLVVRRPQRANNR